MISNLSIKNIALIQELNIEFKKGLNILSGETGAGKSIIIDSINFVLGDRADRSLIRYGESVAKVEVVFTDIKNKSIINRILQDSDLDGDDDCIIVSRTMTNERSECRINRKIVNLTLLRKIVSLLVDTHTQNEHQNLLKISEHIKILDRYNPSIYNIITKYRENLNNYYNTLHNLSQLPSIEERERQIEILTFQTNEIERIAWQPDEDEELKNKRYLFYNSQKIISSLSSALECLNGDDGLSGLSQINRTIIFLSSVAEYDNSVSDLIERMESASIELKDISDTLCSKLEDGDILNIDINKIERRIEEIRLIKKKYGKTYEEVQCYYNSIKEKLDFLENSESKIEKLNTEKDKIEQSLIEMATKIHLLRKDNAIKFCNAITNNLNALGMKNAVFEVKSDFDEHNIINKLNANGAENIEFMLSPNFGEPIKPLAKIASGGEMSRFMLAVKNIIAETDDVDTLIFDEIDTGISGAIAKVVAQKLYGIAKTRQVIAITHLPQLASMGDINYLIEKVLSNNKTLTKLRELNENEVYFEIMRLSGAVENSEIGLSNAKELKIQAENYKKTLL